MALLGFDTATPDTAVCAWRNGAVIGEALIGLSEDGSPGHATRLLEELESAAGALGGWSGVERLVVGLGPGSFTGLRVGIATARGLSASTGIPAIGVCTLDALGLGISTAEESDRPALAVLDARRGEVFAALRSATGEPVWGPWVGTPEELRERLSALTEAPLAGGSGAVRFRHELESGGATVLGDDDPAHRVAARHLCALAAAGGDEGRPLEPIYLRAPDAERWRERDNPRTTG